MPRPTRVRHVTATLARRSYAQARSYPPSLSSKKAAQRIVSSQPSTQDAVRTNTHVATFSKTRRLPWVISSIFAGIIGLYATQLYIAASKPLADPDIALLSHQKDVAARYDDTADSFD
nr:hypothetical protein CFP56_21582 [Quercus suber]